MQHVSVSAAKMRFEFGKFDFPGTEDCRIVHSSHVVSMVEWMRRNDGEGWHEHQAGASAPRPLGGVFVTPAAIPFHARGRSGTLKIARLIFHPEHSELGTLPLDHEPELLQDCLNMRCPDVALGMHRLIRETRAPGFASDIVLDAVSTTIMVDVLRYLRRSRDKMNGTRRLSHGELQTVSDYVEANLSERIAVSDLARLVGKSDRHFMRLFRAATGETVHRFVERQRFEKAKCLLETRDLPLKQIAHQLGFASRVSFTLAFQRMAKQSPQEYRRELPRPTLM